MHALGNIRCIHLDFTLMLLRWQLQLVRQQSLRLFSLSAVHQLGPSVLQCPRLAGQREALHGVCKALGEVGIPHVSQKLTVDLAIFRLRPGWLYQKHEIPDAKHQSLSAW